MRKSLIAGASVFALVAGLGGTALAGDVNEAVSLNTLNSTVVNDGEVGPTNDDNDGIGGGAENSLNNDFGNQTFKDEVLNQNNINSGINSAQQGGNAAAIAIDGDGVRLSDTSDPDVNFAKAGTIADQKVENNAFVNADDEVSGEDDDGIAGQARDSLNNDFGSETFENQAINQNNINSGINSAQQGANAAAISVDLDGAKAKFSANVALSGNYLDQDVENDAVSSDAGITTNQDNDAIAGEVDDSLRNDFGNQTFDNQVINQNNINAGINSAQQGANTVSIAASVGDVDNLPSFGVLDLDNDTQENLGEAVNAFADALDIGPTVDDQDGIEVEEYELNLAASRSKGTQKVKNTANNSGEADNEEDGGIGGDVERSLHNDFGNETFQDQAINQNNINSGINSAQQGANTLALAVDTDERTRFFNESVQDWNIAISDSNQTQDFDNTAKTDDLDNDGVGGFDNDGNPEPTNSLFNKFGEETFQNQVINQNNINAGINNGQQGMNTSAMAIDASPSETDLNFAYANSTGLQTGSNTAEDNSFSGSDDDTGLGIGGNPGPNNLNNKFGDNTFENQVINQNNINAGINSAQQGGNTTALAIADSASAVDENISEASADLTQGKKNDPLTNTAKATGEDSGGVGGNPHGSPNNGALSNHFGSNTFENQVMNQNNINSGINSAQQGANTVAMSLDLGGPGGLDLNSAVSTSALSQTVTNTAMVTGDSNAGIGGGAVNALNNNFGNNTFQNQVMSQNNINSGINSAQQGANTIAISFSGGS